MTVQRNGTSIGSKVTFWVFSSNTALNGNATGFDILLLEANFLEGGTACNTDLSLDYVNSSDFFCNGMLDLIFEIMMTVLDEHHLTGNQVENENCARMLT